MATAKIHLLDSNYMGDIYFCKDDIVRKARELFNMDKYEIAGAFKIDGDVEEAAEELFDLTNNPYRQEERVKLYGRGRSLSVGDMVEVNGSFVVCAPFGWKAVEI